jgi:hypothetical protein
VSEWGIFVFEFFVFVYFLIYLTYLKRRNVVSLDFDPLHVFRSPDYGNMVFGMSSISVYMYVCMYVCMYVRMYE